MTYRHTIQSTAAVAICFVALVASHAALAAEAKRVLVLHSFSREVKPWKEMGAEIHAELMRQSPWPLDIVDQPIVTARKEGDVSEARYVEYLEALFEKQPIDLILSIGAPAAVFVQRHRQKLFAATPMVIAALEQRRVDPSFLTEKDVVAGVAADFPAVINNILHVLPDTKTVAVVMGDSPNERYWLEVLREEYAAFADRVSFIWLSNMSFADISKQASALPPNSAIFFFLMNVDASGVSFEGDTAMQKLRAIANAPIFTHDDTYFLSGGIVGGPMHSYVNTSRHAVAVAMRVLRGEKPGDIKVSPVRFAAPKYDWREMQRWGISERKLPPGSSIYFREPTPWEQYRIQIIGGFSVVLFQAALILWLIYEHWRRQRAEAESVRRADELARMNRFVTAGELSATIAHEIRQPLAAMSFSAAAGLNWLKNTVPNLGEVQAALQAIAHESHRADEVIKSLRAMFRNEQTVRTEVNVNELVRQVIELTKHTIETNKILLRLNLSDDRHTVVHADPVQLQQVILNLILNAVEALCSSDHWARILRIETGIDATDAVFVVVEDSGPGIDKKVADNLFSPFITTKPTGMGVGLSICKSIIENHGGQITATPAKPRGAALRIILPRAFGSNNEDPAAAASKNS